MTDKVELDTDIPIPDDLPLQTRSYRAFPWDEMRIGDSFFVENRGKNNSARQLTYLANKRYEARFVAKKVDGGYRIWRTE